MLFVALFLASVLSFCLTNAVVIPTGVIRPYTFTVTRQNIAPDGVNKTALLVNGQFPGPMITANYGDTFQITVNNEITGPTEGTAFHWHGLLHTGSPWYDGVPAVDMCPIAPGTSFTYIFLADQAGTSWWHSHYDAQFVDGLFGPMIINATALEAHFDFELPPILLSAHYHEGYHALVQQTLAVPPNPPAIVNNLINGKGTFDCSQVTSGAACTPNTKLSTFHFQTGKIHLLRLVNVGAEGTQHFTIDNHTMTIIANDYVPVVPYQATFITLGPGQRTDILVQASGVATNSYYMRANISGICDPVIQGNGLAVIYYPNADQTKLPNSTPVQYDVDTCTNDPLSKTVPLIPSTPPSQPATVQQVNMTLGLNASGNIQFSMNGQPFYGDYNAPILLLAQSGNDSYPMDPQWNVYNFGSNTSIRLIINNETPLYHPMHLHGHNPWILAEGAGSWDGTVTNPLNPQRRDVQIVRPFGYVIMEFNADNPGVWPMHCHISWHIATGLYINVLERPADIKNFVTPAAVTQVCRDWWTWTGHNIVDQIDAGL